MSEIILSWPDKRLSPNARGHWAAKAKAASNYRREGYISAKASGAVIDWDGKIHAFIDFYPPDKRRRDDDNLIASFKSARDGIAEALGVDDKRFITHPLVREETAKAGRVVVRLSQRKQ